MIQIYLHLILLADTKIDQIPYMCIADFALSYVSKKADDLPVEPDEIT